jgi:hypothetical protein
MLKSRQILSVNGWGDQKEVKMILKRWLKLHGSRSTFWRMGMQETKEFFIKGTRSHKEMHGLGKSFVNLSAFGPWWQKEFINRPYFLVTSSGFPNPIFSSGSSCVLASPAIT